MIRLKPDGEKYFMQIIAKIHKLWQQPRHHNMRLHTTTHTHLHTTNTWRNACTGCLVKALYNTNNCYNLVKNFHYAIKVVVQMPHKETKSKILSGVRGTRTCTPLLHWCLAVPKSNALTSAPQRQLSVGGHVAHIFDLDTQWRKQNHHKQMK